MRTTSQSRRRAHRVSLLVFAAGSLVGCSGGTGFDPAKNFHEVVVAATAPLEDLNLRREEIPPALKTALQNTYSVPTPLECPQLRTEIAALDQVLGAEKPQQMDLTTFVAYREDDEDSIMPQLPQMPNMPDRATLIDKSADAVHDKALGFLHDQTNILPFRSIIRTITGAEQHARKVKRAQEAGLIRRAYLKGIATAKFGPTCLAPPVTLEVNAAPMPPNR